MRQQRINWVIGDYAKGTVRNVDNDQCHHNRINPPLSGRPSPCLNLILVDDPLRDVSSSKHHNICELTIQELLRATPANTRTLNHLQTQMSNKSLLHLRHEKNLASHNIVCTLLYACISHEYRSLILSHDSFWQLLNRVSGSWNLPFLVLNRTICLCAYHMNTHP